MIININPIEPGDAASPNLWNSRFAAITEVVNGNLDSDNYKNGSITREKIATGAVSSDKIAVDRYIDANGWTVNDLGTTKTYTYAYAVNGVTVNSGARKDNLTPIRPPVGRTSDNLILNATWFGSYSGHAIVGIEKSGETPSTGDDANPQGTFLAVMFANQSSSNLPFTGTIFITATEKI